MTNLPTSPKDRKVIFDAIEQMSHSMTREQGEKDYRKETIDKLSKDYEIPKKFLTNAVKDYNKDQFKKRAGEQEEYSEFYEEIVEGKGKAAPSEEQEED